MTATSTAVRQLRILLVEDHRVFADVLALRLRAESHIAAVEVAYSLAGARSVVRSFLPDLILLDFQIAGDSGLELLDDLDDLPVRPAVLVLSGIKDSRCVVDALEAGVQGWVSKEANFEHLVQATDEVQQGRMFLSPSTVKPVIRQLLSEARGLDREPSFVDDLSCRELEVLRCLVAGMTRREIASHLYLSVNTVRTHVQRIMNRANEHSTLSLVARARDNGVRGIDEGSGGRVPRQRPRNRA
jgi:DNA-binding NarL/FixJ family response regulator